MSAGTLFVGTRPGNHAFIDGIDTHRDRDSVFSAPQLMTGANKAAIARNLEITFEYAEVPLTARLRAAETRLVVWSACELNDDNGS